MLFNNLKENLSKYLKLRVDVLKLDSLEKASGVLGYFSFLALVILFLTLGVFYLSFGLAVWMETIFENRYIGMWITGGLFFLVAFLFIILRKPLARFLSGRMATLLLMKGYSKKEEDED